MYAIFCCCAILIIKTTIWLTNLKVNCVTNINVPWFYSIPCIIHEYQLEPGFQSLKDQGASIHVEYSADYSGYQISTLMHAISYHLMNEVSRMETLVYSRFVKTFSFFLHFRMRCLKFSHKLAVCKSALYYQY